MCLAASSGFILATQDDDIQQMSFLLDFWCLLADSGGLAPTSPFLLPWKRTVPYQPSSSQSSPPVAHKAPLCLQIYVSYFTILLTPMLAAPNAPGTGFSRKTGLILSATLWACLGFRVTSGKSMKSYLSLRKLLSRCSGCGLDNLLLMTVFY